MLNSGLYTAFSYAVVFTPHWSEAEGGDWFIASPAVAGSMFMHIKGR